MPSETDCLNDALAQIGAVAITAIDDGSVNANYCQRLYPALRQSLLRSHHWNFALTRIALAQNAIAPVFEFAFAYTLPADCLKVKEYNGASVDTSNLSLYELAAAGRFAIEGRTLLSNDGQVKIVYVRDVTDPNQWDALFYQVVATWLAGKLAHAITKDHAKGTELIRGAIGLLLPMATAVDGQEGTVTPFRVDELLWGR